MKIHNDADVTGILESIEIPQNVANLQLPDPYLLNYYKDTSERILFLDGDIDETTLEFQKSILRINLADSGTPIEKRVPIRIFINSVGGDVQVMWSLINTIKISKTPVYTIVYCNALSAAAHILAAGHKRFALPGATVLIHSGSCQYCGDVEKVESAKKYYDSLSKKANDLLLSQTKIQQKDLKKKGASDWYMTADEAFKHGIVDEIINDIDKIV